MYGILKYGVKTGGVRVTERGNAGSRWKLNRDKERLRRDDYHSLFFGGYLRKKMVVNNEGEAERGGNMMLGTATGWKKNFLAGQVRSGIFLRKEMRMRWERES